MPGSSEDRPSRGVIKSVLAEELANSERMRDEYERALKSLPEGSIVVKNIKGNEYHYLAVREGSKVRHIYKGKLLPAELKKYEEAKKKRAMYRKQLAQVKKQIRFLRSSLRGKEAV